MPSVILVLLAFFFGFYLSTFLNWFKNHVREKHAQDRKDALEIARILKNEEPTIPWEEVKKELLK